MNTKRQTIWLVSMLSIMVVLSAYYLFTNERPEDLASMNADDLLGHHHVGLDHHEVDLSDYDWSDDVVYLDDLTGSEHGDLDSILNDMQAHQQSTSYMFDTLHSQRDDDLKEQIERLLAVTASGNIETIAQAQEEMYEISDKMEKISHLEDVIRRDFPNAIIKEEHNKWHVMVNTDRMEKSQAASIMNMVIEEMDAGPEQVTIEIRP